MFARLFLFIVACTIASCATEDPGTFEPDLSAPIAVRGCEEWKRRDPEADC
jgi:hypothetical protein